MTQIFPRLKNVLGLDWYDVSRDIFKHKILVSAVPEFRETTGQKIITDCVVPTFAEF